LGTRLTHIVAGNWEVRWEEEEYGGEDDVDQGDLSGVLVVGYL
jgi:hypothetical protein